MDDFSGVGCFQSMDEASDEEPGNFFREFPASGNVVPQVSSEKQVHYEIQIHAVLKSEVDIDNKLALNER